MSMSETQVGYLKTIAKGAGLVLIGTIISKIISIIYLVFVARYFGAEDYGLFSLAVAVISLFSALVILGLPTAVTRYVSYYENKKSKSKVKGTITDSLKITLQVSIIMTIILILSSDLLAFYLFHDVTGKISALIKIMSLSLPFYSLFMISNYASVGFKKIEHRVYTEYISQNSMKLIFTVIFGVIGLGAIGIGLGWTLSIILTGLLSVYLLNRIFPLITGGIHATGMRTELLRFSLPLVFIGFFGVVVTYADSIMLGYFKNPESVGIYNAVMPIAQILMIPSTILISLLLSVFSEAYVKKGIDDVKNIFNTVTKWSFYMAFPVLILFLIFPSFILNFIFSKEFFGTNLPLASSTLILLSCSYFLTFITQPIQNIFYLLKKNRVLLAISTVGILSNFSLNLILIPAYGIIGASISLLISFILTFILFVILVYKHTKISGFSFEYFKSIVAAMISIVVCIFLKGYMFFIFIGIIYFGLYIILLLIFRGLSEEDKIILHAIIKKITKK